MWLLCRLIQQPGFRDAYYKSNGKGGWRVPAVNETCCVRTNLADLLDAIGAQVERTTNCTVTGHFLMQRQSRNSVQYEATSKHECYALVLNRAQMHCTSNTEMLWQQRSRLQGA